ncbi:hypothetical protein F5884DRAFT_774547 [Xylogone sp. PMI_703]|nr:hypothetical protein F5884DRAFT_774547 [Xylogone sp. PMI_703]
MRFQRASLLFFLVTYCHGETMKGFCIEVAPYVCAFTNGVDGFSERCGNSTSCIDGCTGIFDSNLTPLEIDCY